MLLDAQGLTKGFGGLTAVAGMDLAVPPGSIVGLIGPNGSGKTTLFNLVSGLLRPDRGRVLFKKHDVTGLSPHRIARMGLGRTFQIPALFRKMTVQENLWVPAIDEPWEAMRRRAAEWLEFFRLMPLRDEPAEVLSGGQQKVLELARALMRDPDLLLLDECTAGVQPAMVVELLEAIRRLRERGKAFVIIEHNMDVIQDLCEQIVVMHEGHAIARGDLGAVKRDAAVVEAYLGR